jgi:hypothetical protein
MSISRGGDSASHDLRLHLPKPSTGPPGVNRNMEGVALRHPGACRGAEREDPCHHEIFLGVGRSLRGRPIT